jgi:hypothetical protein
MEADGDDISSIDLDHGGKFHSYLTLEYADACL